MSRHSLLPVAVVLVGVGVAGEGRAARESPAAVFRDVVQPFVQNHCVKCHGPENPEAGVSLHALSERVATDKSAGTWSKVLDQLELGAMPPDDEPQPAGAVRKRVMEWIDVELGHAGFVRDKHLMQRPEYGNYVDHEKLFDGSITQPSYSLPRVWRLRAGLVKMGSPFPVTDDDYAALQRISEPETMRLRTLSEAIADQMIPYMLGRKQPHRNNHHNPEATRAYGIPKLADPAMYEGDGKIDRENVEADINTLLKVFLSREPSPQEVKRYADFMEFLFTHESDPEAALATVMRAMVMTPESIYRMELGMGGQLPDGRRMLSQQELAVAVPASLGSKTVIHGLTSRDDVEQAVRDRLRRNRATNGPGKTPHGITPRFMEFMRHYFGYDKAIDVFKGDRNSWHASDQQAARLVEETDRIVAQILRDDKDVLRRLLTTDQIIVSRRTGGENLAHVLEYYEPNWKWERESIKKADRKTFLMSRGVFMGLSYLSYYGLDPDTPLAKNTDDEEPIKSPVPRSGILTQPSWLQAHSTFTDNHVVHRGKWIRERLLGGTIPEVPVGVDAAIPDTADMPLRERLAQTREAFCWRCHEKMDPLGYPFEIYDDFGRFRADGKERLINGELAGKPVDTSGAIMDSGDPALDGPVSDAIDLIRKLAESDRARQVFVRHVFRFFLGRNETLADSQTLIRADQAYVESGGSFEELIVSLLTSDSFLYRRDRADND